VQPWELNWETPSLPGASADQSAAMIEADRAGRPFEVSIDNGAMQGNLQAKPAKKPWEMEWEEPAPAPKTSLWSDVKNLFGIGVDTMAQDFRELASKALPESVIHGIDSIDEWWSGKSSDALLKGEIERKQKALSPEQQAAGGKLWWDDKTGSLGDAWKDPRSYLGGVVESIPETLLTMVPSVALAKGAYAAKLGVELAAGVARTEAERTAAAAAAKTAYLAGAAGEGSLAGAQSSRQVRDDILAIPEETLQKSDAYMALRKGGLSPQAARESLASDASTKAFLLAGITTGMFGGAGDAFLARAFTRGVEGSFVGRVVKGMVSEGVLEEFPQSYLQQVAENVAKTPALPGTDATAGALNQGLGGLATGAAMGGGFGAVSRAPAVHQEVKPDPVARVLDAPNVDEAIAAAKAAVETIDYAPPNVAEVKAENLSLAPLEAAPAEPGLDFPTADPLERAAAVEKAAEAEVARMEAEAERIPYEPTPVPSAPLELAPQESVPGPEGLDVKPFLQEQQLAKAQAVEQAAAPQFTDYRGHNGAPVTFQAAPGAATYAQSNGLTDYAPRQVEGGWVLSKPAESESAPGAGFQDFRSADGAARAFKTEKAAALYARANRLADYRPRDTAGGWVLSRPATAFQAATGPLELAGAPTSVTPAPGTPTSATVSQASAEAAPVVAQPPVASEVAPAPASLQGEPAATDDNAARAQRLRMVEGEIGWAEHGGSMIRAPSADGMGEVTGRTPWVAKSDFWPGRPAGITPAIARSALDKVEQGAPLRKAEQRFIAYAEEWLNRKDAEATAPKERTFERRRDEGARQRVADMTPEEMKKALLTDDLTGLGNRRAFQEAAPGAVQVSADADSLKYFNDTIGHQAGDELLRTIGQAFQRAGVEGFHISGDEFTATFDTEEQAYEAMGKVKEILDRATLEFTMPDGSVVTKTGVGLSYGIGPDTATSEIDLQRDKRERQDEGHRAARGEEPPGVRRIPAGEARVAQGTAAEGSVDGRAAGNAGEDRGDGPVARAEPAESIANDRGNAVGRNEGGSPEPSAPVQVGEESRGPDRGPAANRPTEVAPPEPQKTPAPAGVSLSSVPPGILKKITVPVEQHHDGEGVKTVEVSADQAVKDIDDEIAAYEKLLACVRAA
jgi:GGDEF domain-containing protein